jgi:hypothetical protein
LLTIGSVYSNIGCFEQAVKNLKYPYSIEFMYEPSIVKRETYLNNHLPKVALDNWFNINYSDLPDVDILCFQPPKKILLNRDYYTSRKLFYAHLSACLTHLRPAYFILVEYLDVLKKKEEVMQLLLNEVAGSFNGNPIMFPENKLGYDVVTSKNNLRKVCI